MVSLARLGKKQITMVTAFLLSFVLTKRLLYDVWDTARIIDTEETYEQRVHFFHLSLQILKVMTYIVLGLIVLLCAIVSKGSLLLMTNAVGHVETVRVETW